MDEELFDQEIVQAFASETLDLLNDVEPLLVANGPGCVDQMLRAFHTVKGSAAFLGFGNIGTLTHTAESLMVQLRSGSTLAAADIDRLCEACDCLRGLIDRVMTTGHDDIAADTMDPIVEAIRTRLEQLTTATDAAALEAVDDVTATDDVDDFSITDELRGPFVEEGMELLDTFESGILTLEENGPTPTVLDQVRRDIHSFKGNCGFFNFQKMIELAHATESLLTMLSDHETTVDSTLFATLLSITDVLRRGVKDVENGGQGDVGDTTDVELLVACHLGDTSPQQYHTPDIVSPFSAVERPQGEGANTGLAQPVRRDIRVDLDKLDILANLVGELLIAESAVVHSHDLKGLKLQHFDRAAHRLHMIINELQDITTTVRMVPISTVFRKMLRLVHDLSRRSGKPIQLQFHGEDTEIDKALLDAISDPLIHMVRNAADHGIDRVEERERQGKKPEGTITLSASQHGNEIRIVVEDDGKGLSRDAIVDKARANGLLSGDASTLSDQDVYGFIFEPGFSTKETVTDISGRGVGMDVVKRNIENVNGKIDIHTERGCGTRFTIRLPLTTGTVNAMLLRVGTSRYAMPLYVIRESLRPLLADIVVRPDGQEFVTIRDTTIPVVRLYQLHQITPDTTTLVNGALVVVDTYDGPVALFVDEIQYHIQAVIKPLSGYLGHDDSISGCTILRDGKIALIIDVDALLQVHRRVVTLVSV